MNGNDLMNAISGLDPKYIDEAAFELHGKPAARNRVKTVRFRRSLSVVLPIAAAAALAILVTMPAILRLSKSGQSTSPGPASDSAMNMQSETAAESAPSQDIGDAAAEAEPAYEAEEPVSAFPSAPSEEFAAYGDASAEAGTDGGSAPTDALNDTTTGSATEAAKSAWSFTEAACDDGILTIEVIGTMPGDPGDLAYSITRSDAAGADVTLAAGDLRDVLKSAEPLTIDITALALTAGDYTLTVAHESIGFTVTE